MPNHNTTMDRSGFISDDEILRPAQAAKYLKIGRTTLWRWAKEKANFPRPIRMSPTITVFRRSELDAYINSFSTQAP